MPYHRNAKCRLDTDGIGVLGVVPAESEEGGGQTTGRKREEEDRDRDQSTYAVQGAGRNITALNRQPLRQDCLPPKETRTVDYLMNLFTEGYTSWADQETQKVSTDHIF